MSKSDPLQEKKISSSANYVEGDFLYSLNPTAQEIAQALIDQARIVIESTPKNLLTAICAALIMAFSVWLETTSKLKWVPVIWFIFISGGLLNGIKIAKAFKFDLNSPEKVFIVVRKLVLNGIYCAVVWGSTSWVLMPYVSNSAETFLIIATAMVIMGGGVAQGVYRNLIYAFIITTTLIFCAGLLIIPDIINILISIAFILLSFVVLSAMRMQENAVVATTVLRLRTEKLLKEKSDQQYLTVQAWAEAEKARTNAEIANQSKTTFLKAASHDLRQPMHALVQYFGHLQNRNKDAALNETIQRAGKALDAMQDLLDSILDISKLMMGAIKPSFSSVPIAKVLERIEAQLAPVADDKGLKFSVDDSSAVVRTDGVLLERILRNLILNAIRYTKRGSVTVKCAARGRFLIVQVRDTGVGIKKIEVVKIFEEFYQVENESRERSKGLGLGLSLVRQMCNILDHRLRVRSTFGQGSIFSLRIPIDEKIISEKSESIIEQEKADFVQGAFVVLIDDDVVSLDATRYTIKNFGCKVLTAQSGLEAIEKLQGQDFIPNLIISDYRLDDGQTGVDAIEMVVKNQQALFGEEFNIPAFIITGDTAAEDLKIIFQAGYQVLHKPVAINIMYATINKYLTLLANEGADNSAD